MAYAIRSDFAVCDYCEVDPKLTGARFRPRTKSDPPQCVHKHRKELFDYYNKLTAKESKKKAHCENLRRQWLKEDLGKHGANCNKCAQKRLLRAQVKEEKKIAKEKERAERRAERARRHEEAKKALEAEILSKVEQLKKTVDEEVRKVLEGENIDEKEVKRELAMQAKKKAAVEAKEKADEAVAAKRKAERDAKKMAEEVAAVAKAKAEAEAKKRASEEKTKKEAAAKADKEAKKKAGEEAKRKAVAEAKKRAEEEAKKKAEEEAQKKANNKTGAETKGTPTIASREKIEQAYLILQEKSLGSITSILKREHPGSRYRNLREERRLKRASKLDYHDVDRIAHKYKWNGTNYDYTSKFIASDKSTSGGRPAAAGSANSSPCNTRTLPHRSSHRRSHCAPYPPDSDPQKMFQFKSENGEYTVRSRFSIDKLGDKVVWHHQWAGDVWFAEYKAPKK
ncbi:uncharacterized protein BROUX77_002925 [Berkeleyomyces rouxiae]|uniref:uncharacterized protein n=1 Tax=Berkeleyomyces rouxiae TaxID=2035830 RepID=UPI003B7985F4